jgi:hypothetical protein
MSTPIIITGTSPEKIGAIYVLMSKNGVAPPCSLAQLSDAPSKRWGDFVKIFVDSFRFLEKEEIKQREIEIKKQIERMHKIGFVHGDLVQKNIVISNNKVYFIGFEKSNTYGDKQSDFNIFN